MIKPLDKVITSSRWDLNADSFDRVNYRPGSDPPNSTLNPDTPKGVLGGMCAVPTADWESGDGDHTAEVVLGLFNLGSEGNAFENAPAAASGKVAIHMHGGDFDLFVFETNSADSPYASILASYTIGATLYCSPFGLLTPEVPSGLGDHAGGVDTPVAVCVKVPTASELECGIKLLV
jgi:hypothetical protein